MLQNGDEYNHFISHATSQYIGKDQSPRCVCVGVWVGGWVAWDSGEHGSLMGCTVLFLPKEAEATKHSQKRCFNYTGPSINHATCS